MAAAFKKGQRRRRFIELKGPIDHGTHRVARDCPAHVLEHLLRPDKDPLQPRIHDVIRTIGEIARGKTSEEIWLAGQKIGFTWMVFNTPESLLRDEQLRYRKFFQRVEHPEHNASFDYTGPPYQLSTAPWRISRRPPLLGEHNAALEELLR